MRIHEDASQLIRMCQTGDVAATEMQIRPKSDPNQMQITRPTTSIDLWGLFNISRVLRGVSIA